MSNKKQFNNALIQNKSSFLYYYYWLKLLALSMFSWSNLPEGCDSDFIEKNLFENGRVIFANSPEYGLLNLSLADGYEYNYYDKPIVYDGFAGSFKMKCDFTNSVIVQNNILNLPTIFPTTFFADKISKVDRVADVNLLGIKTPLIFQGSQQELFTLDKIINDIYSNVPMLKIKNNYDINKKVDTLKTDVPFLLDKLRDEKISVMSEFLTFIGINNVNITKKERLVKDEATSNNELIKFDLNMFLSKRQEAVDIINKKFDTNISVNVNKNIVESFNNTISTLNKE